MSTAVALEHALEAHMDAVVKKAQEITDIADAASRKLVPAEKATVDALVAQFYALDAALTLVKAS